MYNVRPEVTKDQPVTSPSGYNLGCNFHVRRSESIRSSPHSYEPLLGATIEWKINVVVILVYMMHDGYYDRNIERGENLLLLDECNA